MKTTELHVRLLDHHVDDRELGVGEVGRDRRSGTSPKAKPVITTGLAPRLGEAAQRLFALGVGLHLELLVGAAGLGLAPLGAVEGGLVERFVELAAEVEDDRRIGQRRACGQRQRRRPRRGNVCARVMDRSQLTSVDIRVLAARPVGGRSRADRRRFGPMRRCRSIAILAAVRQTGSNSLVRLSAQVRSSGSCAAPAHRRRRRAASRAVIAAPPAGLRQSPRRRVERARRGVVGGDLEEAPSARAARRRRASENRATRCRPMPRRRASGWTARVSSSASRPATRPISEAHPGAAQRTAPGVGQESRESPRPSRAAAVGEGGGVDRGKRDGSRSGGHRQDDRRRHRATARHRPGADRAAPGAAGPGRAASPRSRRWQSQGRGGPHRPA